jgi:hypothetical protein
MAARLIDWIDGLAVIARAPLTGPRTVGSAASESTQGYVQTTASPFGLWRWQLSFRGMWGPLFRHYRGLATALHGGANAVRVPFCDPDLSWSDAGVAPSPKQRQNGIAWISGSALEPFEDTRRNWTIGRPWETVAAAAKGADTVTLGATEWGRTLAGGEWLGFAPFHFGLYLVTEIFPLTPGQVRIWPPLRKALAATDYATLSPVMAMRLEGEAGATAARGLALAADATMTLIEVEDADVRQWFTQASAVAVTAAVELLPAEATKDEAA